MLSQPRYKNQGLQKDHFIYYSYKQMNEPIGELPENLPHFETTEEIEPSEDSILIYPTESTEFQKLFKYNKDTDLFTVGEGRNRRVGVNIKIKSLLIDPQLQTGRGQLELMAAINRTLAQQTTFKQKLEAMIIDPSDTEYIDTESHNLEKVETQLQAFDNLMGQMSHVQSEEGTQGIRFWELTQIDPRVNEQIGNQYAAIQDVKRKIKEYKPAFTAVQAGNIDAVDEWIKTQPDD